MVNIGDFERFAFRRLPESNKRKTKKENFSELLQCQADFHPEIRIALLPNWKQGDAVCRPQMITPTAHRLTGHLFDHNQSGAEWNRLFGCLVFEYPDETLFHVFDFWDKHCIKHK